MQARTIDRGVCPDLKTDGTTVEFASYRQFQQHHAGYLCHGGVLVKSRPLHVGTRRKLRLSIPDLGVEHEVEAFVVYRTSDLVGFVIEGFDLHKMTLKLLASG